MQGIPLEECIVYTSGRIPVDMVMKVIRAGVPVLASKAMPTRESVLLAEEFGLEPDWRCAGRTVWLYFNRKRKNPPRLCEFAQLWGGSLLL